MVLEVILTRREPAPNTLDRFYELMLREKGLRDGAMPDVPALSVTAETGEQTDTLRLMTLKDVVGVNALAPKQLITFNSGLTLLSGEHATGKTGYVRVLKRLAQIRVGEAILPDVRAYAVPAGMGATISYSVGDVTEACLWAGEAGLAPFTRMSVFDARSVVRQPCHIYTHQAS